MKKKILIIEDNTDIRENIAEILELADYAVLEAGNGKIGVEVAIKELPDLVLCDIMMPELDGYGVLYLLNKHPETMAIPLVFLTAKAEMADLRKGMDLGADDYLTKPFDDMELLHAIEGRLKKRETQQRFYNNSLDKLHTLFGKRDGLEELKKIIDERKDRLFKKNQVIYYEGDKGHGLFLVLKGRVKTIKACDDRELMTGVYAADHYLGIQAVLANEPYGDTAIAIEDSILCQLPKDNVENLLNLYPDIAREFIKLLSNDIKEKEEQLLQLAYFSVRKRMAETILRLYGEDEDQARSFKITRQDLASMAGMAIESVSRTLADFRTEGLIEKKGSNISLLDPDRLRKMKN
ncbi:response regulator [Mucilaginibacter sp.]|uniref:response regulator n=1 Tax=Mucilaginibacter sp. TaxID=1882438 RepID=UPI00374D0ED4